MKALTIQQPWAGLLVLGIKKFETRSWNTKHRGTLAIHSSARMTKDGKELIEWLKKDNPDRFFEGSEALKVCSELGFVLGTVEVSETISSNHFRPNSVEALLGDFSSDRWLWRCEGPVIYKAPVPAFGKLSLWNWDDGDYILSSVKNVDGWNFLPTLPVVNKEVLVAMKYEKEPVQAYWTGKEWKGSALVRENMSDGFVRDESYKHIQEWIYAWMELPQVPPVPDPLQ